MDKRIKYSLKEKIAIVTSINKGERSCYAVANQLRTSTALIRRWLNLYNRYGKEGLQFRHGSYNGDFKVKVVRYMLKNHLSLLQTAAHFGIPQEFLINNWLTEYQNHGAAHLRKENRGRKHHSMSTKGKKKNNPSASVKKKFSSLEEEVEYLRAENAFLKKLDALIREEEAAKASARQPKPSAN